MNTELLIFKLENNDPNAPKWDYFDEILIVAETGWEARQLSIDKYNPDRKSHYDWPNFETNIACTEVGRPLFKYKKGDVITEVFRRG